VGTGPASAVPKRCRYPSEAQTPVMESESEAQEAELKADEPARHPRGNRRHESRLCTPAAINGGRMSHPQTTASPTDDRVLQEQPGQWWGGPGSGYGSWSGARTV
jgi:hypothetical protein